MKPAIVTLTPGDRLLNFALPDTQGLQRIFYFEVGGGPSIFVAVDSLRNAELSGSLADLSRQMAALKDAGIEAYVLSGDEPSANLARVEKLGLSCPVFSDPQGQVLARLLAPEAPVFPETQAYHPKLALYVLDPNQRILGVFRRPPYEPCLPKAREIIESWRSAEEPARLQHSGAPILLLPRVFDGALCRALIEAWKADHQEGGLSDGTKNVLDPKKKRNLEHLVADADLNQRITQTLGRRLGPEVAKVFNYRTPYGFEGFNILSYRHDRQDFFGLHRDTLRQERQRRFALSLNLNDDYEGGTLRFPEYGPHSYSPKAGAALVFSASLLHEALPVTKGQRWVLVTFLCDPDQAAPPGRPQG